MKIRFAINNPPFNHTGIDKPLFFNNHLKTKNNWSVADTITNLKNGYINELFGDETTNPPVEGRVSSASSLTLMTIRVGIDKSPTAKNNRYLEIEFDDRPTKRYFWVIAQTYITTNTWEYSLEMDYWTTYSDIAFKDDNIKQSIVNRRMPNRYYIDFTDNRKVVDTMGPDNLVIDPIPIAPKYVATDSEFNKDNTTNPWLNCFRYMWDKANDPISSPYIYCYALIAPKPTEAAHVVAELGQSTKNIPTPYVVVPVISDSVDTAQMNADYPITSAGQKIGDWNNNKYVLIANAANTYVKALFLSTIPPYTSYDNANFVGVNFDTLTNVVCFSSNTNFYNQDISTISNFQFTQSLRADFTTGNLGVAAMEQNEPLYWNGITTSIKCGMAGQEAGEWPIELWQGQPVKFKVGWSFDGALCSTTVSILVSPNASNPQANVRELGSLYNKTFMADLGVPSSSSVWDNYITQHKNSFTMSLFQGVIGMGGSMVGVGTGVANFASKAPDNQVDTDVVNSDGSIAGGTSYVEKGKWSFNPSMLGLAGASLIATSLSGLFGTIARAQDLKNMPRNVKEMPNELTAMISNINQHGVSAMVGKSYLMKAPEYIISRILTHARIFGNPIIERMTMTSLADLQLREFWNYWNILDVMNAISLDIPSEIRELIALTFQRGTRLWPYWLADNSKYVLNYVLENWEITLNAPEPNAIF